MRTIIVLALCLLFASCSHQATITFEKESADIVPSDEGLYAKSRTVCVKSANQNVMYSANEFTSKINILINTVEKAFLGKSPSGTFSIVKETENPDLLIEIIGVEDYLYQTNKAEKANGKKKVLSCTYKAPGFKTFVKVTNKDRKIVNYTFYNTPCTGGCTINYKQYCDPKPKKSKRKNEEEEAFEIGAKGNLLPAEQIGREIARHIFSAMGLNK